MPGHLLERDPGPARRPGRDEVEAALARLAGERARQGDHRPQPEDRDQRVADPPRQESTERLDSDRLAEQAAQGERQRGESRDELLSKLDRRELGRGPVGGAGPEHEGAGHEADDERRATAVADRLGIDRPQAHEPRPRPRSGPSDAPGPGLGGHRGGAAVRPVLGQEDVLEIRLAADHVDQAVPGRGGDDRTDPPVDPHPHDIAVGLGILDARQGAERLGRPPAG